MYKKLMVTAFVMMLLQGVTFASMYATGGTEVYISGDDTVAHIFTENGTFVLKEEKLVRILSVGGGGGGGAECGGGGGGGGVVEQHAVILTPGEYSITIGAGGLGGKQGVDLGNGMQRGTTGGDTVIIAPNGEELIRAYGGGGGGSWSVRSGGTGGSGGGAAANGAGGSCIDPSQGNFAGNANGGSNSLPTGGGGAGEPSKNISLSSGQSISGSGGAGIISDISGTAEMYGAGGGGGNYNYGSATDQAPGGDGIGGFGQGNTSILTGNEKGRDGFGGGGGGGSNVTTYIAADGGSGTVIFRLSATDEVAQEPSFLVYDKIASVDHIKFMISVIGAGASASDGKVSIYAQVADSIDAWDEETGAFSGTEKLVASGVAGGNVDVIVGGLRPLHDYVARIIIRNDAGDESISELFSFSTIALIDSRWTYNGVAGQSGLYQYFFSDSGNNDLGKEFDEFTPGLTVQIGAIAAGLSNSHSDGIHGTKYVDSEDNTWSVGAYMSYGYVGYMFMEEGVTYNFFKYYYDGVRLEIDGKDLIRNTSYENITIASYTSDRTGWHRIRIWLTSPGGKTFGVPKAGWSIGLGYNTNGVTAVTGKPGPDWLPMENTEDYEFLRTFPKGRMLDISNWSVDQDNNSANFSLDYGEAYRNAELYAVYGPIYGGNTLDGWAHVESLGVIDTASGSTSFTLDDISDLVWFKFVAVDEDGIHSWSTSKFIDFTNPSISISQIEHSGDKATISVRVDSVGKGDFSLNVYWGENADLSGASVTNIAVTSPGVYDVVVDVIPGSTFYVKAEAETSEGGKDSTLVDSFTTLAAASMGNFTSSVSNHKITFSGNILTKGAGNTTITLWTGDSPDTLSPDPEPVTINSLGQFLFHRIFPGEEKTIYWKFVCENVALGGTRWESESPVYSARTSESGIEYTWKAEVADGDWTNTNNWVSTKEGALGYPKYSGTLAKFPNNSTNRIHLVGFIGTKITLGFSNSHITIYGDGADASYLYTYDSADASLNQSVLRIDNMTLDEYDMFDWVFGGNSSLFAQIEVVNSARLNLGGNPWAIDGKKSNIFVANDSEFYFGHSSVPKTNLVNRVAEEGLPVFATQGECLTIEGRASFDNVLFATINDRQSQTIRLRGASASLNVIEGGFGDSNIYGTDKHPLLNGNNPLTKDVNVVFEPEGGNYTNVVSYMVDDVEYTEKIPLTSFANKDRAFGEMVLENSTGKIFVSVDTGSMKASTKSVNQHLILWKSGIDTSRVELVQGDGYELHYTYGWPSVATEPTEEGELPTGVWGRVDAISSTIIIVY